MRKARFALAVSAALFLLLLTFFLGAQLYRTDFWPFGQSYYSKLRSLLHVPIPKQPKKVMISGENFEKAKQASKDSKAARTKLQEQKALGTSTKIEVAQTRNEVIKTGLLNLNFVIQNVVNPTEGAGGGLASTDKRVLIARSQSGELFFFDKATKDIHPIGILLPKNGFSELPDKGPYGKDVNPNWLRYNDIEFFNQNGHLNLIASYTTYDPDKACFSNRLAIRKLEKGWSNRALGNAVKTRDGWQIVYETTPCLPFLEHWHAFYGHEAGGRMVLGADGSLYLTVGEFGFDGTAGKPQLTQLPDNSYGKIIKINPADWSASVLTVGHRNPQGITTDGAGMIWSVEHGAVGGDELNLIREGSNYGWPLVTLGISYGSKDSDAKNWPLSSNQGRHDNFEQPVFAWVPSIGVSNVKFIKNFHSRWNGDLLVASMKGTALRRLRITNKRVMYDEPIIFEDRIRYVEMGREKYTFFLTTASLQH